MKKCQTCGNQNADDMRFCLNCGASLPDAPVIVNFGGGAQSGQSNPGTNPYGKSMETRVNQPVFQPPTQPQNYSMVPPPSASRGGGSKKIMIAIGGVVALFVLLAVAGAAIVGYNMMKKKEIVTVSPTPSASPSASPSSSSSPSPTKSSSPTPKPSSTKSSSDAKATFDKVWVDYNVTEDGERGMRIHVKFNVSNMQGVNGYVLIYFEETDGTKLTTSSSVYGKDGNVAVKKLITPGFDETVYKDLDIFMPYSALNLTKGKYELKMDVDLADEDENMIQHMGYHEFQYEKFQ